MQENKVIVTLVEIALLVHTLAVWALSKFKEIPIERLSWLVNAINFERLGICRVLMTARALKVK